MTLKYLLDTNVISEPLWPSPRRPILANLRAHEDEVAISAVTWHELWYGCLRLPESAKRDAIEAYLRHVVAPSIPILPYGEESAAWHAAERARLVKQGRTPPFADGQIAAVAYTNGLILVTLNVSDYVAFERLRVESWIDDEGQPK